MPRKTKNNRNPDPSAGKPTSPGTAPETRVAKPASRRTSGTAKKGKTSQKKGAAAQKATSTTDRSAARSTQPTEEQIRMRAYFISERRHRLALPGDASSDWLEAKRQLEAEHR